MLTLQQTDLLSFLETHAAKHRGVMPTYREMQSFMQLKSIASIHRIILGLEDRGAIRRLPGKARAIEIIRRAA